MFSGDQLIALHNQVGSPAFARARPGWDRVPGCDL
jgi:hypothetical protein